MNAVERVKAICKERKIPISKLESDCGFSNGYIGQLRKGTFPNDRLETISEYLGVSEKYITTGKEPEFDNLSDEMAIMLAKIQKDTELAKALQKYFAMSDAHKKHVLETIDLLSK